MRTPPPLSCFHTPGAPDDTTLRPVVTPNGCNNNNLPGEKSWNHICVPYWGVMTDLRSKPLRCQKSHTTEKIDRCLGNQNVVERKKRREKNVLTHGAFQLPNKQRT